LLLGLDDVLQTDLDPLLVGMSAQEAVICLAFDVLDFARLVVAAALSVGKGAFLRRKSSSGVASGTCAAQTANAKISALAEANEASNPSTTKSRTMRRGRLKLFRKERV